VRAAIELSSERRPKNRGSRHSRPTSRPARAGRPACPPPPKRAPRAAAAQLPLPVKAEPSNSSFAARRGAAEPVFVRSLAGVVRYIQAGGYWIRYVRSPASFAADATLRPIF
jgi:hypothetical protein